MTKPIFSTFDKSGQEYWKTSKGSYGAASKILPKKEVFKKTEMEEWKYTFSDASEKKGKERQVCRITTARRTNRNERRSAEGKCEMTGGRNPRGWEERARERLSQSQPSLDAALKDTGGNLKVRNWECSEEMQNEKHLGMTPRKFQPPGINDTKST